MLLADLHYALRQLARQPGFAAVAILTLALGIGANTAIFSIVNTVLLAPLPYPQANQLVSLRETTHDFSHSSVAYPNFLDWQRLNRSFTGMAAYRSDDAVLAGSGPGQLPEHLATNTVSANLFQVLGVKLFAGPGFSPQADRQNGAPQAVITYGLWQRRFGADPHLVGQAIPLNGKSYEVMGILPRDFWFEDPADIFTPVGQYNPLMLYDRANHPGITVVARLKPGVTLAAARADMASVGRILARQYPKDDGASGVNVAPMKANLVRNVRSTLLLLLGAVGLVLLIACANVANLLLARATGRRRELAVRQACGASGTRIVRQLLTESLLLGLAGGAVGLLLAYWGTRLAPGMIPGGLPRLQQIAIDPKVLGFTLGASLLSGILFGLLPAWQSRRLNLQESLKDGGRSATSSHHRAQSTLAIVEVALSLMLLAAAGLLIQSIIRLGRIAPGFTPSGLLTMQVALAPNVLNNGAAVAAAHRALLERVNHLPGVAAAAETSLLPLDTSDSEIGFWLGGSTQPPPQQMHSALNFITSPEYLRTMEIPLLRGRYLSPQDQLGRQTVLVVDQDFARSIFGPQDPIGRHVQFQFMGDAEIVGEVGHVKFWGLGSDQSAKIRSQAYMSINQLPLDIMTLAGQGATLVVRSANADALSLLPAVRAAVAGPNRDQPVYRVKSMDQIIAGSLAQERFLMALLGIFAAIALVLAGIGIYGVLSYSVSQRSHEVGIRMALGARQSDVLRQMVLQGARLALIGAAIGVGGALLCSRFIASRLYGVAANDPTTLIVVTLLLVGLAMLASYLPARRAARVDPVIALRGE